jgi:type II secretory pathway component PulK
MRRRGFALLAVLWVIVSAGLVAGAALATARLGSSASRNRILLLRSRWAREACAEVLLARYAQDPRARRLDTLDLGGGAWCRAEAHDPDSRLDLNLASPAMLRAALGDDSLADALLDWRDADDSPRPFGAEAQWYERAGRRSPRNGSLASARELALVRGFDRLERSRRDSLVTVLGTGRVNLGVASEDLYRALPGIGDEAHRALLAGRRSGTPVRSLDELAALVSPRARAELVARYEELLTVTSFETSRLVARVEGGVRDTPLSSGLTLVMVLAGSRLAVVRREAE